MALRSRRRRDMTDMTPTRMLLSTAALAAVAALFAGGANAMVQDDGGGTPAVTIRHPIENRVLCSGVPGDSALRVDRAVAAANEAYETYRDKTAIAARKALFTDQQPSVQFRGAHRGRRPTGYPATVTLPTASSASNGVDWSWVGLGAGMTALLAGGIAGVGVARKRRRGLHR